MHITDQLAAPGSQSSSCWEAGHGAGRLAAIAKGSSHWLAGGRLEKLPKSGCLHSGPRRHDSSWLHWALGPLLVGTQSVTDVGDTSGPGAAMEGYGTVIIWFAKGVVCTACEEISSGTGAQAGVTSGRLPLAAWLWLSIFPFVGLRRRSLPFQMRPVGSCPRGCAALSELSCGSIWLGGCGKAGCEVPPCQSQLLAERCAWEVHVHTGARAGVGLWLEEFAGHSLGGRVAESRVYAFKARCL